MNFTPLHFIGEQVEVYFEKHPAMAKKPHCPDGFTWREQDYSIDEVLNEWFDYDRKGRMAKNMTLVHTETAKRRGSWGVGEFYFRVRTSDGRIFDLYYDRAPKSVDDRKGAWFLDKELGEELD
jgi:hypothetical protein